MDQLKLVQLTAENFKKLRMIEISPDGRPMTQITGRNGQGKSSVLDSFWFALKGQKALPDRKSDAVRRGTERAKVTVKLGNGGTETFTITRTLGTDGNPPTLTITPAVHKAAGKTPQDYLDDLFGALTFDPLAFAQMSTADQVAELKKTAKVDLDFEELAGQDEADYNERSGINREIKLLEGQILGVKGSYEGLPKEKINTAALEARLSQAGEENRKAQELFRARQDLGLAAASLVAEEGRKLGEIETQRKTIAAIRKQLEAEENKLSDLRSQAEDIQHKKELAHNDFDKAPNGEPVDVSAIAAELQAAERTNRAIDTRAQHDKLKADKDAKQQKSDQLTRAIEARTEKKRSALSKAKIPVEGLTFDEREVKYNGNPIGMLGEGEQIRISTLIGMAANPKLRILCIRHGEALDEDGIKMIAGMARENKFQILMARVESSGKVGIVIEDGSIAARNED